MSRIDDLSKKLIEAKIAYYTATPIMSDAEFDSKLRELKSLDPTNKVVTMVGTPVVGGEEVTLKYQMVSTDKALSVEEMGPFWRRVGTYTDSTSEFVESQKVDGLSLNLTYVNGMLVKATTSGDGFTGSEKTAKAMMITDIPKKLNSDWSGQVSGEAYLSDFNFYQLNEILAQEGSDLQKTSRNSTAGLLNSENLTNAKKKLALVEFLAWGVYEEGNADMWGSYDTYSEQLEKARELGFNPVSYHIIKKSEFDPEKAFDWLAGFEYENDGIVYRINDNNISRKLGAADDYLNGVIALKPKPEGALTTVTDITWEVGSLSISPVVHYEPIVLGGATCAKTAGHSVKNLIACGAAPGEQIFVARSGGVIPRMYNKSVATNFM